MSESFGKQSSCVDWSRFGLGSAIHSCGGDESFFDDAGALTATLGVFKVYDSNG